MNAEHEFHLRAITSVMAQRLNKKYRRGQAEHGGNLWERPVLKDLADEITDLNTYLVTHEQHIKAWYDSLVMVNGMLITGRPQDAAELLQQVIKDIGLNL